jgi:tetratricopeptide (TPR) repeat protein
MNNLAVRYNSAGKSEQALALYEEALKWKKIKDGPENHGTLVTLCNLASTYAAAGKFEKAIPLYEEALKLRTATLGPEHPETVRH